MFPVAAGPLDEALAQLAVDNPVEMIVVVEESPEYPGNLVFQPVGETQSFFERYQDWISRHLVLNELHNLRPFTELLTADGFVPIFAANTGPILKSCERWEAELHIADYRLHPFQSFSLNRALERARTGATSSDRSYFWNWSAGAGKAEPVSEPVLTPSGWRTMGDLRVGDEVIGSDGKPTRILAVHPQGVRPVWRVEFNDGTSVRCNASHLWTVTKGNDRYRGPTASEPWRKPRLEPARWQVLSTRELARRISEDRPGAHRWKIPYLSEVQFVDAPPLPMDPYTLGVLLGDGSLNSRSVCTDKEIVSELGWRVWPSAGNRGGAVTAPIPRDIMKVLKSLGLLSTLSQTKFIPEQFKRSSVQDRWELLRGLLDTDGSPEQGKHGVEFTTTSERLRDDVADLARSLGVRVTVSAARTTSYTGTDGTPIKGRPSWRLRMAFHESARPFRLTRKADRYVPPTQRTTPHKLIKNIVEEGRSEEQVCITVAADDSLYVTSGYALTHNSYISGAGARALVDSGDVDLVIACTLSKLKENLRRTYVNHAGLRAVINDHPEPETRRKRYTDPDVDVFVMNYEKLRVDLGAISELTAGRRVLFILDEAHKLITDSTKSKTRKAFDKIVAGCEAIVWPMSATVVGGNPLRFRDVFALDGGKDNPLGTRTDFVARYADSVRDIPIRARNGRRFTFTTYDWSLTRLQDVRHRTSDRTMAVRKTDPGVRDQFQGMDCLPEFVQATDAAQELFSIIQGRAAEAKDRGESLAPYYLLLRIAAINPAALRHSESPEAAAIVAEHPTLIDAEHSAKIVVINDMLESIRESRDKAVLFCHWTNLGLLPLADHLKVPHVLHYGTGQSARESQAAQDKFISDPDITCFASSDAGTHGLNLQCARYVINADPTYSYDDLAQRNARIDRADSHLTGLTAYVLITEGSVEERVWSVCNERRRLAAAVQGTAETLSYGDDTQTLRTEMNDLDYLIFGKR